ncbi:hypothetical protein [Vibrio owensii]|uniref:hypothetical protein n=1 Tax=Vibrio owensii TaxID=696485 RepID=UPI0038CD1A26
MIKAKAQRIIDTLNILLKQEHECMFFVDLGIDPASEIFTLSDFTVIPNELGLEMRLRDITIEASIPDRFFITNGNNWRDVCLVTQKAITSAISNQTANSYDESEEAYWSSKGGYEEWLRR